MTVPNGNFPPTAFFDSAWWNRFGESEERRDMPGEKMGVSAKGIECFTGDAAFAEAIQDGILYFVFVFVVVCLFVCLLGSAYCSGWPGASGGTAGRRGAGRHGGGIRAGGIGHVGALLHGARAAGARRSARATLAAWSAAVVVIPLDPGGVVSGSATPRELRHGVVIGVLTAAALVLLAAGLEARSAFTASALICVEPVLAAGLAWLVLGELLRRPQVVGGAVVLLRGGRALQPRR